MDDNSQNNIIQNSKSDNNFLSLKVENEEYFIENNSNKEKQKKEEKKVDKKIKNYQINYSDLLRKLRNDNNGQSNEEKEFYCNLLLIPSVIDFSDKIATLSMLSYCYQKRDNSENIFNITHKLEKIFSENKNIEQTYFINIFGRAGCYLNKNKIYFHALKYVNKAYDIINNSTSYEGKKKELKEHFDGAQDGIKLYIKEKKELFENEKLISKEKCEQIKELIDLIIVDKYNINQNEEDQNYIYTINKEWVIKAKYFIETFISKFGEKKDFINELFGQDNIYNFYFDEGDHKNSSKSLYAFPGPINNYPLVSFKDCWKDNNNLDENVFIRKNLILNKDYTFINYKDWNLLNEIFDNNYEIKRRKNNLDLISIKFLLLDKRINLKNKIFWLKEKYIQINKDSTIYQLKDKILNCINYEFKASNKEKIFYEDENEKMIEKLDKEVCFYILNKDKKDILIEIISAFKNEISIYESLYLEKIEFEENNTLNCLYNKYDKGKHILIIEIINKNDFNFLLPIENNNYKCNVCGKKINDLDKRYKCELCNYSLFCSRKCAENSTEHFRIDNYLGKIMEKKFNLNDLLSLNITSILSRGTNLGRKGLNNLGNTCYINSSLQCLSNTVDLTKYFLKDMFTKELNNGNLFGVKGQLSKEYYNFINLIWNGESGQFRYINTNEKEFKMIFNNPKLISNQEQKDAHDFILAFLDNLHEELNRKTEKKNLDLQEQKEGETDEEASTRCWNDSKSKDDSIITDLFQGQFKSTVLCSTCQKKSVNYDNFKTLGLPIPQKKAQFQFKLFTFNGNYTDLNVKINERTEIKDIINKSLIYLDKKNYIEYTKKVDIKDHLFNYNITDVPQSILYNNIQIIEFTKDFIMTKIFDTSYDNINTDKKFDNCKYLEYINKKSNTELILYEKDINSNLNEYVDIYIYPITEIDKETKFFNVKKESKIISYPILAAIKKSDTFRDLDSLIFQKIRKILHNQVKNQMDSIEICYPHFNDKWDNFKLKNGLCPICGKSYDKNTKYCTLFNIDRSYTIEKFLNNQNKDRPLIFFAKSFFYNRRQNLFKGMELFIEKKNELELNSNLTIYDSLYFFNYEEILDGENMWNCPKCKAKRKARKNIQIYRAPYNLIIQLKKFKDKKNPKARSDVFIEYKHTINLKDFIVGPDKENSIYDLYGVINYKKFMNSSHYISYCYNLGDWISYDDETLSDAKNIINKDAYILFYKRRRINS